VRRRRKKLPGKLCARRSRKGLVAANTCCSLGQRYTMLRNARKPLQQQTAYLPLLGSRLPLTSRLNISKESANSVGSAGVLGRENQAGVERQEFSSFLRRRVVITHLAARRNPPPPPSLLNTMLLTPRGPDGGRIKNFSRLWFLDFNGQTRAAVGGDRSPIRTESWKPRVALCLFEARCNSHATDFSTIPSFSLTNHKDIIQPYKSVT